jgi:hypothetical protein
VIFYGDIYMDNISINRKKYLILIPAFVALVMALIPTIKYQWPLGWDIIYHVQYAQIYAHNGFTLINPLLNAPVGQKIGYPPLFHFLIAAIGTGLGIDFFQVARLLQPLLAMSIVLSVSYVAYKLYGEIAGIGAGFLMLSSMMVERIIVALPENLALIFLPLAVYLYYRSIEDKQLKMAILGGLMLILVIGTHHAATLCLSIIIMAITIIELVVYRDWMVLKNLVFFLLPLIAIIIVALISIQIWAPQILQGIAQQGFASFTGLATSINNRPLGLFSYLTNMGVLVLIFSLVGLIHGVKNHNRKNIFIIVWIVSMVFLSYAYILGINVISYRVLIYILIPLCILGGYGITIACRKLHRYEIFSSGKFPACFLGVIILIATVSGFLTFTNPEISYFGVENEQGVVQIAPPSAAEVELADWFKNNGNKSRSFVISNMFAGTFIATQAKMPLHYGFEYYSTNGNVSFKDEYINSSNLSMFQKEKIGYIVYDKKLITDPSLKTLELHIIDSEFYPLYYFTQDIHNNIDRIKPDFSRVVFENQEFIVCEVKL